jgi:hypothetical protein
MNWIVKTYLLRLIIPATALVVFMFVERRSKVPPDEVPEPISSVSQPKFKVIPGKKR